MTGREPGLERSGPADGHGVSGYRQRGGHLGPSGRPHLRRPQPGQDPHLPGWAGQPHPDLYARWPAGHDGRAELRAHRQRLAGDQHLYLQPAAFADAREHAAGRHHGLDHRLCPRHPGSAGPPDLPLGRAGGLRAQCTGPADPGRDLRHRGAVLPQRGDEAVQLRQRRGPHHDPRTPGSCRRAVPTAPCWPVRRPTCGRT